MIDIITLRPGDKVKVVDEWVPGCNQNRNGLMDCYRGQIVTVNRIDDNVVRIIEDGGRWLWFSSALVPIDYHDPLDELSRESDEAFSASLRLLGL